jgi:hypothetical protein
LLQKQQAMAGPSSKSTTEVNLDDNSTDHHIIPAPFKPHTGLETGPQDIRGVVFWFIIAGIVLICLVTGLTCGFKWRKWKNARKKQLLLPIFEKTLDGSPRITVHALPFAGNLVLEVNEARQLPQRSVLLKEKLKKPGPAMFSSRSSLVDPYAPKVPSSLRTEVLIADNPSENEVDKELEAQSVENASEWGVPGKDDHQLTSDPAEQGTETQHEDEVSEDPPLPACGIKLPQAGDSTLKSKA